MPLSHVATLFGALGHPTRVRALALLHEAERDVSDLAATLAVSPANLSQHLAILRTHHLVNVRRDGNRVLYSLRDPRLAALIDQALDVLADDISQARQLQKAIDRVRLRK